MIISKEIIKKALELKLGVAVDTLQGMKYNCPHCDSGNKYNLEVSTVKNIFNCWSCGYRGGMYKLLKENGGESLLSYFSNKKEKKEEVKGQLKLPVSARKLIKKKGEPGYDYLMSRKFNPKYLDRVLYDYENETFIFPNYDENNNLVFYQEHDWKNKSYRNHGNIKFPFWFDRINKDFPIIITEGIYDAMCVPNAVPIIGKDISDELITNLFNCEVIIGLDNDAKLIQRVELKKKLEYNNVFVIGDTFDIFVPVIKKIRKDLNEVAVKSPNTLIDILNQLYNKDEKY